MDKKYLTEAKATKLEDEKTAYVTEIFKKVEAEGGNVELLDIFKYTYEEMTPQLKEQYETYKQFLDEGGK